MSGVQVVQCRSASQAGSSSSLPGSGLPCLLILYNLPCPALRRGFSHVLAASSSHGRSVLPRAAALLDVQAVADVSQILDPSTFVRPIYAGNALATVRTLGSGPCLLTVRATAFAPAPPSGGSAPVEPVEAEELTAAQEAAGGSEWVGEDVRKSGRRGRRWLRPGCSPCH